MSKNKKYFYLSVALSLLFICSLNLSAGNREFDEQEILNSFRNIRNLGSPAFDDISTFNPATTSHIDITALTDTKFVIVYRDNSNSGNGTAIIGEAIADSISWGNEYVFNSGSTQWISVAAISSSKFVVSYQDMADSYNGSVCIGEVTGTTISFGDESDFISSASYKSITALSDTLIVVVYKNTVWTNYAELRAGIVDGNDILSWGTPYTLSENSILDIDIKKINSTKFIIGSSYQNPNSGTAYIGTVSGTTITIGSSSVFNSSVSNGCSISLLSDSLFVVSYRDAGNSDRGTSRIGHISGYDLTWEAETLFSGSETSNVDSAVLSDSIFVIVWTHAQAEGRSIYGKVTGSNISWSNYITFTSNELFYNCITKLTGTEFVTAFCDKDDNDYGKAARGYVAPMEYVSSSAFQDAAGVLLGYDNALVMGIEIDINYGVDPFSITDIQCNSNGTNDQDDISNAKVFYTGIVDEFSTVNQFGSAVSDPEGSFSFTGTQQLKHGTNYFWLTYEISSSAELGNVVDAECVTVTVDDVIRYPEITAPAGTKEIISFDRFSGYALSFDGVEEYVETTLDDLSGSELTIEYWFNGSYNHSAVRQQDGGDYVVAGYDDEHILSNDGGTNGIDVGDDDEDGQWHHVAMTWEQNTTNGFTSYLDGELIDQRNSGNNPITDINANVFFGSKYGSSQFMNGSIDEVRIWDISRTSQDIRENMYLNLSRYENGLVGYWQFNEGTGNSVTEHIKNNPGTLYNMDGGNWIDSSVTGGSGDGDSNEVGSIGNFGFPDAGVDMEFTAKSGTDIFVAVRFDNEPNLLPDTDDILCDSQYWLIDQLGDGTFTADISFDISNDVNRGYDLHPDWIKLFTRDVRSDSSWTYYSTASSYDAAADIVTFSGISSPSQFFITREVPEMDYSVGHALEFDGINDSISIADHSSLDIVSNITVEGWIKAAEFSNNKRILDKGDNSLLFWDYAYETSPGGGLQINLLGPDTSWWEFRYDMNYNEWYHFAWTFSDSGELKSYINGELTRTSNFPGEITLNSNNLIIASNRGYNPFEGKIDELRLWNVVRTGEEIRESMHLPLNGLEDGLVSYWQFNEGNGTTVEDNGFDNDGTLYNMDEEDWITSTIPFGDGVSDSQIESTGTVIFTDTGLSMYFNSHNSAEITVTRIDTTANINPNEPDEVFDNQYWVVDRFGSGTFDTDLTFTISEDLTIEDEANPEYIALFTRPSSADTSWAYLQTASFVNAMNNEATFDGITDFSQFIVSRWIQEIDPPQNVTITVSDSIYISWDAVAGANSYKIYASNDPHAADWGTEIATASSLSWSSTITGIEKRFYRVTASTETVTRDSDLEKGTSRINPEKIGTLQKEVSSKDFLPAKIR